MATKTPAKIATISGPDGYQDIFIIFKTLVANEGAIVGTPTVVSDDTDKLTISAISMSFSGTINGESYAAGEVLKFRATAVPPQTTDDRYIDITYVTPLRKDTLRIRVTMAPYEV